MTARQWQSAIVYGVMCGMGFGFAAAGTTKQRHQHGAHVHGTATLNLAIVERTATVELISPADSVLGFEHEAKSAVDQTRQAKALELLRSQIDAMVVLEPRLGCSFAPTRVEVVRQAKEHAEVHSTFVVSCQNPLAGSKVRFGFTKTFPRIETVNVQVVGAMQQVGARIRRDKGEVEVPR